MKNTASQQHLRTMRAFSKLVLIFTFSYACLSVNAEPVDFDVIEKHSGADFAKGYEFQQRGKYEEALQAYSRAIATHPENMETYMHRINVFIELKRFREAQADINRYKSLMQLTSDKDDKMMLAVVALQEAQVFDGLGNSKEALNKYKLALELDDTVDGHTELGKFYKRHGEKELAIKEFQKVKNVMDSNEWGYNWGKAKTDVDNMLKELQSSPTTKTIAPGGKSVPATTKPTLPAKKAK